MILFYLNYTSILGCIYCNKWQETQIFEFIPNQKTRTIELKDKIEKTNLDLILPIDCSSPVVNPNPSENTIFNNNENSSLDLSEIHEDTSQNNNQMLLNKDDFSMDADNSVPELDLTETSETFKQKNRKKIKRKLGFLQMRIDSTIYFDNMGYSYQIQNEKNDKKYV